MKTAEEYLDALSEAYRCPDVAITETIRVIMLESYRAGMEAAARMCASAEDSYGAYYCAEMIADAAKTAQLPQ